MSEDVFEPVYGPQKIEFWQHHWEELDSLVQSPKTSAHIAEHLHREWTLLQVRQVYCLCKEQHAADSLAVDPACSHEPSGGGAYRVGTETAACIMADLRRAADELPANWLSTRQIWTEQGDSPQRVLMKVLKYRTHSTFVPEPSYSRPLAIKRMAKALGWRASQSVPV